MTDYVHEVLDELVPRFDQERGDWERVVADARRKRRPRVTRRRLVVVALAIVALAIPLFAAASQDWWFLRFSDPGFEPVGGIEVVKTGTWDGQPWELAAYVSANGLCFSLTPTSDGRATGEGAGLSCAPIVGVPSKDLNASEALSITMLAGSSIEFPPYAVGPVIDDADEVAIHFHDGTVIRTPTFDAPSELGAIRFYAVQLEKPPFTFEPRPQSKIQKVVGLTSEGEVVACVVEEGVAEPAACE
jgi:hypothetical protein